MQLPNMLEIKNLKVSREGKIILNNLNLTLKAGEINVLMGPNGSGKSTLASTMAGHTECIVDNGSIIFNGQNLIDKSIAERANAGLFVSFQQPIAIPGLSQFEFLRTIYNVAQKNRFKEQASPEQFLNIARRHINKLGLNDTFLTRSLNDNFSGGEQKRNELLQMLLLDPEIIVLDEIDSGLDAAGQKLIVNTLKTLDIGKKIILVITHNPTLYKELAVKNSHIIKNGEIVKSGNKNLLDEVASYGYSRFN